jgi:hypothetical protein
LRSSSVKAPTELAALGDHEAAHTMPLGRRSALNVGTSTAAGGGSAASRPQLTTCDIGATEAR